MQIEIDDSTASRIAEEVLREDIRVALDVGIENFGRHEYAALLTTYNCFVLRQQWLGNHNENGVVRAPLEDDDVVAFLRCLLDHPATGISETNIKEAITIVHDYLCLPSQRIQAS